MPIKFSCPSCLSQIEVSRQYASQQVKCPKCQETIQAPAAAGAPEPAPIAPPPQPAAPPPAPTPSPVGNGGGMSGGEVSAFKRPSSKSLYMIWLGVLLVAGSFILQGLVDNAGAWFTRNVDATAKVRAEKSAELYEKTEHEVAELKAEIAMINADTDRSASEKRDDRKDYEEDLKDLEKELRENKTKQNIQSSYIDDELDAKLAASNANAAKYKWDDRRIMATAILDLPKFAGCALIVLFTLPALADPKLGNHAKLFTIVACGAILLILGGLLGNPVLIR